MKSKILRTMLASLSAFVAMASLCFGQAVIIDTDDHIYSGSIIFSNIVLSGEMLIFSNGVSFSGGNPTLTNVPPDQVSATVSNTIGNTNLNTEGIREVGALGGHYLDGFFRDTYLRGASRDKPVFNCNIGWVPYPSLVVSWGSGDVYDPVFGYRHLVPGTNTIVNFAVNYAYWGTNLPNVVQWTTGSRPDANTTIFLGEFSAAFGAVMNARYAEAAGNLPLNVADGHSSVMPSLIVSGMNVYPSGTEFSNVSATAGIEYQDMSKKNIHPPQDLANTNVTHGLIVYAHTNAGLWGYALTNQLPVGYWDNGTNVMVCNTDNWYRGVFVSMAGQPLMNWVYPQAEFTNYAEAIASDDPTLPAGFDPYIPKTTAYVFQGGDTNLRQEASYWLDRRFMIRRGSLTTGGGSGTTPTLQQVLVAGRGTGGILPNGAGLPTDPDELTSKAYVDGTINSINSYRVYVDSVTGNDATGTIASSIKPFKTIQAAIDAAAAVATLSDRYVVTVSPGFYDENITMKNYIGVAASDIEATVIDGQITYPPAFTDYAGAELQQLTVQTYNRPAIVYDIGSDDGYGGVRSCYIIANYDNDATNKSVIVVKRGTVEIYGTTYIEMSLAPTNGSESICRAQFMEHTANPLNAGVVRFTSYGSSCVLYCDDENDNISQLYSHDSTNVSSVNTVQGGVVSINLNTDGLSYSNSVQFVGHYKTCGRSVADGSLMIAPFTATNTCNLFMGYVTDSYAPRSRIALKDSNIRTLFTVPKYVWLGAATHSNDELIIVNVTMSSSVTNVPQRYADAGAAGVLNYVNPQSSSGSLYLNGIIVSEGGMPVFTNQLVIKQYVDQMSEAGSNAYVWVAANSNAVLTNILVVVNGSNGWNTAYTWVAGNSNAVATNILVVVNSSNNWNSAYTWVNANSNAVRTNVDVVVNGSNNWNTSYAWVLSYSNKWAIYPASTNVNMNNNSITNAKDYQGIGNMHLGPPGLGHSQGLSKLHLYATNATPDASDYLGEALSLDGNTDTDKELDFCDAGAKKFAWYMYRGELGKYLYLWNYEMAMNIMTVSRTARFAFNKQDPYPWPTPYFVGSGTNDMLVDYSNRYLRNFVQLYRFTIDGTNAVNDTFKLETQQPDISTAWTVISTGNLVKTSATNVQDNTSVYWGSLTRHQTNDYWVVIQFPALPQGSMTVGPPYLDKAFVKTNLSSETSYVTRTFEANNTTFAPNFNPIQTGTNSALYLGMLIPFNAMFFNLTAPASGAKMVTEYWNGGAWARLNAVTNYLYDGTADWTVSGNIKWDTATMSDWAYTNLTVNGLVDSYYWIRFRSTNNVTTVPTLNNVSRHGDLRFGVSLAYNDEKPWFRVTGDGKAWFGSSSVTEAQTATLGGTYAGSATNTVTTSSTTPVQLPDMVVSNVSGGSYVVVFNSDLSIDTSGRIGYFQVYTNGIANAVSHRGTTVPNSASPMIASTTTYFTLPTGSNTVAVYYWMDTGATKTLSVMDRVLTITPTTLR